MTDTAETEFAQAADYFLDRCLARLEGKPVRDLDEAAERYRLAKQALAAAPPFPAVQKNKIVIGLKQAVTHAKIMREVEARIASVCSDGNSDARALACEIATAIVHMLAAAAPPAVMPGRTDLVRAMCHVRPDAPCTCADKSQTDDYSACKIVARHANAILDSGLLSLSPQGDPLPSREEFIQTMLRAQDRARGRCVTTAQQEAELCADAALELLKRKGASPPSDRWREIVERCAQILDVEISFAREHLSAITDASNNDRANWSPPRIFWDRRIILMNRIAAAIRALPSPPHAAEKV